MQTNDFKNIKYEVNNHILTLTYNRPQSLNAFTPEMESEIRDAYDMAQTDDDIRVIVVTGQGKGFCAGMDLSQDTAFDYRQTKEEEHRDGGGRISLKVFESKKPVIAAINGAAVGVGITSTLPMDIRIASSNAKMGFVFARRGIIGEACSSYFLPRIVGIANAMELVLSGRIITAQEALKYGLVSKVVEPEELLPTAYGIASEIVRYTAPVSVALVRQMFWRMLGASHPMQAHQVESRTMYHIGNQPDTLEGIHSFMEKREPNFTMSVNTDMPPSYPWWDEWPFDKK